MSEEQPLSRRASLAWSIALVALSGALCAIIYFQPQQLRAPAWVAYSASATFGIAGLLLLAGAVAAKRTQNWLGAALALALVLPGIWVALGTGQRECIVSFPFLEFASELLCRGAFGVGALLGIAILAVYLRHAIVRQPWA
jgi:hypothetical protein